MGKREGMRERWREEDREGGRGEREMKGGREREVMQLLHTLLCRGHAVTTHFTMQRSCSYHTLYHAEVMQLPLTALPTEVMQLPLSLPSTEVMQLPLTVPFTEVMQLPLTGPFTEVMQLPLTVPFTEVIQLPLTVPFTEVMQLPFTLPFTEVMQLPLSVTTLFTIHRGFLTGKYKRGQLPAEGRLAWSAKNDKFKLEAAPAWSVLDTDRNWTILDTAEKIAKARGSCQHRGIIIVIGNL